MKNRRRKKNQKVEARIPFPRLLANILVLVAVFGISYVWLCARCDRLGREINRLETVQKATQRRVTNEQDRWSNLLAPANFERALKRHHLAMTRPKERQIVRVDSGKISTDRITLAYNNRGVLE